MGSESVIQPPVHAKGIAFGDTWYNHLVRGGWKRGWFLWLLGLWLSVATPLAAIGCLQVCVATQPAGECCASEVSLPCSDHPCSCEPCPVCSEPAQQPVSFTAKSVQVETALPIRYEPTLALICLTHPLPDYPEPLSYPPDELALDAHGVRAPPVLG
ncbi:MAG: hypothetical protein NZM10_05745 [Fimbriimonadales bacterium]|nr:hypothetical protein [Fimbriimonadales bacterium]